MADIGSEVDESTIALPAYQAILFGFLNTVRSLSNAYAGQSISYVGSKQNNL